MNLSRIDVVPLDNVENRDITTGTSVCGYHDVLGLRQPSHDIENSRLANRTRRRSLVKLRLLLMEGSLVGRVRRFWLRLLQLQGRVSGDEKVTSRRRNQRRQESNQVVVHVSRVPKGGS